MLDRKFKNISGEEAQGMVEFAIVFPILFFFFLAICQAGMLYSAKQVVQYAAFAAVRSAVVWIPEEEDIDGTPFPEEEFNFYIEDTVETRCHLEMRQKRKRECNWLGLNCWWEYYWVQVQVCEDFAVPGGSGAKLDKVEMAAALACIGIAPKVNLEKQAAFLTDAAQLGSDITGSLGTTSPDIITHIKNQLDKFTSIHDLETDPKVDGVLWVLNNRFSYSELSGQGIADRFIYSRFFTSVNFYEPGTDTGIDLDHEYEAGEGISAEVTHYYSMKIPVINKLIFMAYMSLYLPGKKAADMKKAGKSDSAISKAIKKLEKDMSKIISRYDLSFYPIPIRARSTLTVEGDMDWS